MLHSRLKRVEELLSHEVAKILNYDLRDPRITLAGVTGVKVSRDLSVAIVYVSLLEDAPDKVDEAMQALEAARGYVKHLLAGRLSMKRLPDVHFKHDPSTREAFHIFDLLKEIEREDATGTIADEGESPPDEASNGIDGDSE